MMIDASLGRAACCGMPTQPPFPVPQPPQPVQPPIPMPPVEPDAIAVQLATAQTGIANGAAIPLTGTLRQIGNGLSFDTANRAVIVNEAGVYAFNWHVLATPEAPATAAVITLQSLDGQTVLGYSGTPVSTEGLTVPVNGSTVAALPAGTAWVLVNASGGTMDIPVAGNAPAAFGASLTVTEVGSSN